MRFRLLMAPLVASILLSACGPGSGTGTAESAGTGDAPAPTAEPAPAVAATSKTGIWFEPAGLSACARPAKVMVNWDAKSFEGVKSVDIIAISAAGKEVTFLSAGRFGSRESGQWMRGDSQMILRNHADGAELARATVESIPCGM